jgi:uncharacterized protein YecT (DUF1311 family)
MMMRFLLIIPFVLVGLTDAYPQARKATAHETTAIRDCAKKYADDVVEGERRCLFSLVATPCAKSPANRANQGSADCYDVEAAIWNDLLNDNLKDLKETLDDGQAAKLHDMQSAWAAYRNTTCQFYDDKIGGSMAIPMHAACVARETARRALLLKFFAGL